MDKRSIKSILLTGLLSVVLAVTFTGYASALQGVGLFNQSMFSSGGIALLASAAEVKETGQPQTLCPITGNKITKTSYLDYEGKRVYFCCDACKETFLKDPKKYMGAMESKGVALERCPLGKDKPACEHKSN